MWTARPPATALLQELITPPQGGRTSSGRAQRNTVLSSLSHFPHSSGEKAERGHLRREQNIVLLGQAGRVQVMSGRQHLHLKLSAHPGGGAGPPGCSPTLREVDKDQESVKVGSPGEGQDWGRRGSGHAQLQHGRQGASHSCRNCQGRQGEDAPPKAVGDRTRPLPPTLNHRSFSDNRTTRNPLVTPTVAPKEFSTFPSPGVSYFSFLFVYLFWCF